MKAPDDKGEATADAEAVEAERYVPSHDVMVHEPLCAALYASGATKDQALDALTKQLREVRTRALQQAETTIAPMSVTFGEPAGHRVAAMLAKVEEEAKRAHDAEIAEFVSGTSEWSESEKVLYLDGIAHGLRYGAELATATLGAPTPLDLAVGEICALLPREYKSTSPVLLGFLEQAAGKIAVAKQNLYDDDRSGARVSVVDAAADLLAGMLACDAAKEGDK